MVEGKGDVLLIPNRAIKGARGDYWTEVVLDEESMETEKRSITLGIQGNLYAEVLSGLKEDEKVVVESTSTASGLFGR